MLNHHKPISIALVLILHASIIASCLSQTSRAQQQPKKEPTEVSIIAENDQRLEAQQDGTGLACKSEYTGIGVRISPFTDEIIEIAPGGPADRAGVLIGDILRNPGFWGMEPGTRVTLQINRGGVELELPAVVGHICYER